MFFHPNFNHPCQYCITVMLGCIIHQILSQPNLHKCIARIRELCSLQAPNKWNKPSSEHSETISIHRLGTFSSLFTLEAPNFYLQENIGQPVVAVLLLESWLQKPSDPDIPRHTNSIKSKLNRLAGTQLKYLRRSSILNRLYPKH